MIGTEDTRETGENCKCDRFKCFENEREAERSGIVKFFNKLQSYDEQNVYLAGLITVCEVATRQSRKEEDEADFHSASYKYIIRVKRDGSAVDIPICYKAILALRGITAQRIQNIQKSLKSTGTAPKDGHGRHTNRPYVLPNATTVSIHEHINSFKESIFHSYTEMHEKKEADDVASMLWDFICSHLDGNVEELELYTWTKFLTSLYATQCPFATRPIKHLVISQDHPRLIQYRLTYNDTYDTAVVVPPKKKRPTPDLQPGEF
ncbi:hypothetical protein PR048_016118 [Dryococelus australis]|uniref:Uncharacterized protein n=1 Tax=Dryococelus australis TaxID=614101 RepID=A0ABQ9HIV0_9NEOP|nr:hypothetical protein PR048_016118 [Dryococelus australis]